MTESQGRDVVGAALDLGLFALLDDRSMMAPEICDLIGLDPGTVHAFLDELVDLGLLRRIGDGQEDSEYRSAQTSK